MLHLKLLHKIRPHHIKSNSYLLNQVASLCIGPAKPNPKTLVIVNDLPLSTTNESFANLVSSIDIRKCEVEPGCAIHIIDEVGAEFAAQKIRQLDLRANIKNTCLPSLALHNLPSTITPEVISEAFQELQPKAIRFSGKRNISITVPDAASAIQIEKIVAGISLGSTKLQQHITKSPDGRFTVNINNIPSNLELPAALRQISNAVTSQVPTATLSANPGTSKITVRLNQQKEYYNPDAKEQLSRISRKISFPFVEPTEVVAKQMKKPVLVLHGTLGMPEEKLRKLCMEENSAERVQMTWRSKDITGDIAVAYFKSDLEAQQAMKWIRAAEINEKKIKPSFQLVAEPAVRFIGFPSNLTKSNFFKLFAAFKVARIDVIPSNSQGTSEAIVVVSNQKEAERLMHFVNNQNPGGYGMKAVDNPVEDWCLEFTFPEGKTPSTIEVQAALQKENLSIKSITSNTNISAYIAFETAHQASKSQNGFLSGNIKLLIDSTTPSPTAYHGGGTISSAVSIYPSYALEVLDVPQDQSAQYVVDAIKDDVHILKASRAGTVKFKKHYDVIKGMKALRGIEVEGRKLKPIRNHPVLEEGEADYDGQGRHEAFDRDHFYYMLRDYLDAEPAIRYQMAKNYFERALFTAEGVQDISYLLDENAPSSIRLEARELLNARLEMNRERNTLETKNLQIPVGLVRQHERNTDRLFELFLQREDMLKYSADFADFEAVLGPASNQPGDITSWNNFILDQTPDYVDFAKAIQEFRPEDAEKVLTEIPPKPKVEEVKPTEDDGMMGGEGVEPQPNPRQQNENMFSKEIPDDVDEFGEPVPEDSKKKAGYSIEQMRDHDGHLWHTVLINDDTTQNVTSEGRVMSYRMLIVIGNFKGVGGYGMGKGNTPQLALNSAFRAALNNLIFLDLFENAAFAHDLMGRENNCYVYIRSTPKERMMVANPVMREMLNGFGVVSCSVKVVGRRQPYAMVRALFKALVKHKNIDEIAKERGERYLTMKWMYDQGL